WKIRHEGSPRSVGGMTLPQIVTGLQDGQWEPTDEVMGPNDTDWVAIENHPQLADVAADLEPPPRPHHQDETRLDMNPLIDVALVLLIFFILTTSYATLQKVLDMPGASSEKAEGPLVVRKEKVEQTTIQVEARLENGKPVIRVEKEVVPEKALVETLSRYKRETSKTQLLLDAKGVDWGTVAAVQDAAAGAGISKVHFLVERRPGKGG